MGASAVVSSGLLLRLRAVFTTEMKNVKTPDVGERRVSLQLEKVFLS
jgi:hypothetical protein